MDLWIRSQNKHSLIKAYDLQLDSFNAKKDKVMIINSRNKSDCVFLAEYNTEERALEVLNEIQIFIENNANNIGTNEYVNYIYKMPEE